MSIPLTKQKTAEVHCTFALLFNALITIRDSARI